MMNENLSNTSRLSWFFSCLLVISLSAAYFELRNLLHLTQAAEASKQQKHSLETVQLGSHVVNDEAHEYLLRHTTTSLDNYQLWKSLLSNSAAQLSANPSQYATINSKIAALQQLVQRQINLDDSLIAQYGNQKPVKTWVSSSTVDNVATNIFKQAAALVTVTQHDELWLSTKRSEALTQLNNVVLMTFAVASLTLSALILKERAAKRELVYLNNELSENVEQLRQARDRALSESELKTRFVANISHELRTPLSGIIASGDLLLSTPLNCEQEDLLNTLCDSARALLTILNEILDYSQLQAGKQMQPNVAVNLVALIDDCSRLMRTTAVEKGLDFTCSIADDVPTTVSGNPVRLRQIVLNLISNAIKFTDQGGVRIDVSQARREQDIAMVKIEITDTGIGLSDNDLEKLFTPFGQLDTATGRHRGGTGLGLVICRDFIEQMGGHISVKSQLGKGSTFAITLPLRIESTVIPAAAETGEEAPSTIPSGNHGHVLVVEDNIVLQQLMVKQLQKLCLVPTTVSNGRSALEAWQNSPFDLILMDLHLDGMTGHDVTNEIRQRELGTGAHTPIIAVSASAMPEDRQHCLESGMDDYMSKPVTTAKLRDVLGHWLKTPTESTFPTTSAAGEHDTKRLLDRKRSGRTQNAGW